MKPNPRIRKRIAAAVTATAIGSGGALAVAAGPAHLAHSNTPSHSQAFRHLSAGQGTVAGANNPAFFYRS